MKEKLHGIVAEALGVPIEQISAETSQENMPEWDSLVHMRIFVSVEERFGVHFPMVKFHVLNSVAEYERELTERGIV